MKPHTLPRANHRSCARTAAQPPRAAACFTEPQLMLKDTAMSRIGQVLINVSELRRVPVDPNDISYLEAVGDDTLVRMRSKRRWKGREDWAVKLESLVNRVLPVSRVQVRKLLTAYRAGEVESLPTDVAWEPPRIATDLKSTSLGSSGEPGLSPGPLPAHHRSECAGQDPHGSVSHTRCHKRVSRRRGRPLDNISVLTYTSFE